MFEFNILNHCNCPSSFGCGILIKGIVLLQRNSQDFGNCKNRNSSNTKQVFLISYFFAYGTGLPIKEEALKGVTGNVWECSIEEKFFRIHLRHLKRFNDGYFLSLIAKPTFKIIYLGGYVLRIDFKLLNNDDEKCIKTSRVN